MHNTERRKLVADLCRGSVQKLHDPDGVFGNVCSCVHESLRVKMYWQTYADVSRLRQNSQRRTERMQEIRHIAPLATRAELL